MGLPILAPAEPYGVIFEGSEGGELCLLMESTPAELARKILAWMEISLQERSRLGVVWSKHVQRRFGLHTFVEKVLSVRQDLLSLPHENSGHRR